MRVAILGCGPAGLMAAHAVAENGAEPLILSRKRKSPLYGAQYLHAPIPGVTDRDDHVTVEYMMRGSVGDYRRKVYGPRWDGTVSPEDLEETHEAWDIRTTYDRLWDLYHDCIEDVELDPAGVHFTSLRQDLDLIVSSVPLERICANESHVFRAAKIVAAGDAPDIGIRVSSMYHCPPDTVICNGDDSPSWYRISNIFQHTTVEWPAGIRPPIQSASEVLKPTGHNCDCWPDVLKVGRYGSWQKGVLSHEAYNKVAERMRDGAAAQAAAYNDPEVPTLW